MNADLISLGLSWFFTSQLSLDEFENQQIARVTQVQRGRVTASDGVAESSITLGGSWFKLPPEQRPTVGDWVVLDQGRHRILRLLDRKSLFKRIAAGNKVEVQLIAANVDTLFIVTSCNDEFNESRLERYLALACESEVDPVIILTKADLSDDPEIYRARVQAMRGNLAVELVNAKDSDSLQGMSAWITPGSTVALVGSSGVGKSTIVNSLTGEQRMETAAIREQDAKGRHTTSFRSLHRLAAGGMLLDLPGIRELKVAELDSSLEQLFDDIDALALQCKFRNCDHNDEPGCAVRQAIDSGILDQRRLLNYQKLIREESRHTTSLSEKRQRDRQFSKVVRRHVDVKRNQGEDL